MKFFSISAPVFVWKIFPRFPNPQQLLPKIFLCLSVCSIPYTEGGLEKNHLLTAIVQHTPFKYSANITQVFFLTNMRFCDGLAGIKYQFFPLSRPIYQTTLYVGLVKCIDILFSTSLFDFFSHARNISPHWDAQSNHKHHSMEQLFLHEKLRGKL